MSAKGYRLSAGQSLQRGEYLLSPNGRHQLILQPTDGNLVLRRMATDSPLWATMSPDQGGGWFGSDVRVENARMQDDGNFTVNANTGCVWDTMHGQSAAAHPGAYLELHDNAVLALYHPNGEQLWQTSTHLNEEWMGRLPDGRKLTALSVPGTHDSGTYQLGGDYTKCQSLSIEEQLWAGVRSFDIRCRYMPDEEVLTIHHGASYCNLTFPDVVRQVAGFLAQNPRETVLMMVKQEYSSGRDDAFAGLVERDLQAHASGRVYTQPTDSDQQLALTLGDVRGRIVLLKRYTQGSYGYNVKMSGGSDTRYSATVCSQDVYGSGSYVDTKKAPLKQMVADARDNPQDGRLYFNYASMSGIMDGPESLAKILNPFVLECIGTARPQRLGVIPMDFPDRYLIHRIINTN